LPEGEYHKSRPAFFGSLHGTLNHILVADRAWTARLIGEPKPPGRLDTELYPDLAALRAARVAEDARLIDLVDGYGAADLAATFAYTNYQGASFANTRAEVLTHMFNHHTHHRGQAHGLLSHAGAAPPELDFIFYLREIG
jgi:uncharacterized damage-inducible protein DinB